MSNIDDIWASMKEGEDERLGEYKKRAAALKSKANISVVELIKEKEAKMKKQSGNKSAATSKDKKVKTHGEDLLGLLGCSMLPRPPNKDYARKFVSSNVPPGVREGDLPDTSTDSVEVPVAITADEMIGKISRDLNSLGSEDINERRRALTKLHKTLFQEYSMTTADYGEVFRDCCKPIFKRYADPAEKCRELALLLTESFFEKSSDFVPVLGYFFPVLMQRLPAGIAYDEEMKVFVADIEAHEAYRRGKAVARQDRVGVLGPVTHTVVEVSEEIRHSACRTLGTLIRKIISLGAATILHPYFHEAVMYLQTQLRDPFPDLKQEACEILELLARTEEFNSGMKFFAVALVRAILPVLRHRHAKVRIAAVGALAACMTVPDRAKLKGSGTEAIPDLVGFREENVLSVAAFYTADVQINYLAELVTDKSVQVKEKVTLMLKEFLTEMGDRYDHQTRLLPYLLDLLTDDADSVSTIALETLRMCGQQYEEEHPNDIIEKRQYGVDGDIRINLDKPLPPPFTERPRIGVRLYVRGNTKRFLSALVNELTNWVSHTRLKSAKLLKVVVILCEEHLTMESHFLLPAFIKALMFAGEDSDKELHSVLLEVYELVGRYMHPEAYLHYILPRLRGDREVLAFGADTPTRIAVMELMQSLIEGTKPSQLAEFFSDVVSVLTDPFVIDFDSPKLQSAALEVLMTLLNSMKGKGKAAVEAHFLATGRLKSLRVITEKLFRFFLAIMSSTGGPASVDTVASPAIVPNIVPAALSDKPDALARNKKAVIDPLHHRAIAGMLALVELDSDSSGSGGVAGLFYSHGRSLIQSLIQSVDDLTEMEAPELKLLQALVECPWQVVQSSPDVLDQVLSSLCLALSNVVGQQTPTGGGGGVGTTREHDDLMCFYSHLLVSVLIPVTYTVYPATVSQLTSYSGLYDAKKHTAKTTSQVVATATSTSSSTSKTESGMSNYITEEREIVQSDSNANLWPGLLLLANGVQHLPNSVTVIRKHMDSVMELFVLGSRWSRSPALQLQRMEVLSVLAGFCDFSFGLRNSRDARAIDSTQLTPEIAPICRSNESGEEAAISFPLLTLAYASRSQSSSSASLEGTYLLQFFPRVVPLILSAAKVPSNPWRLRLAVIQLTDHIIQLILERSGSSSGKLKPFASQDGSSVLIKCCQAPGIDILTSLVALLDDSCDDVRHAAVSCLQTTVPFVSDDVSVKSNLVDISGTGSVNNNENITAAAVSAPATFSPIVRRLLRELSSRESIATMRLSSSTTASAEGEDTSVQTHTFSNLLDAVLRSLAVLDPQKFTLLVREAVEEATASGVLVAGGGSHLSEVLSGLLDHSEMMIEFSKMLIK